MLRLVPEAADQLVPEVRVVVERFLRAWPPSLEAAVDSIRLFGAQAIAYDPSARFSFLVVLRERSFLTKVALASAGDTASGDGSVVVDVTGATAAEWAEPPTALLARTFANARREGVVLWARSDA